jgi:hypothetical protein
LAVIGRNFQARKLSIAFFGFRKCQILHRLTKKTPENGKKSAIDIWVHPPTGGE